MVKTILGSTLLILALVACGGGNSTADSERVSELSQLDNGNSSKPHFEAGKFGEITLTRSYTIPSDALFIDVRNDWERVNGYAAGSIGGVVYEYRENGGGGQRKVRDEFVDEVLAKVHGDKNKHIILICHSSSRTKKAEKLLADNGFSYVEHILGGFSRWDALDLPVEKSVN